jgi:hypothetical protein
LYLSEEIVKQMRWHKEWKCEREDPDIMSRPTDSEAWEALDCFDLDFAWDSGSVCLDLSMDGFQPHSEIAVRILVGLFSSRLTICRPINV